METLAIEDILGLDKKNFVDVISEEENRTIIIDAREIMRKKGYDVKLALYESFKLNMC